MPFNIIKRLCEADPDERPRIISALYEKNRSFFRMKMPDVNNFLERCTCPYHINITDTFLDIIHTAEGRICHPEAALDSFAQALSSFDNNVWIDSHNFIATFPDKNFEHYRLLMQFHENLLDIIPEFPARVESNSINAKINNNGRILSPPVAFVGIFHGLHIAQYLHNTALARVLLIEPEPERFMVSCYFLDYEAIEKKTGHLYLALDSSPDNQVLKEFMAWHNITPQVWLRMLPGYESPSILPVIDTLKLLQKAHLTTVRPFDVDMQGLVNTVNNLAGNIPLLSEKPALSKHARIAVAAPGPSLLNDLAWLKKNRKKLIIFAVHGAVKILKQQGIIPDFQFCTDIHLSSDTIEKMSFLPEVPLIVPGKVNRELVERIKKIFMVEAADRSHPVNFSQYLQNMYPSTGNLAVAMAYYSKPEQIYLVGLDLGYRHASCRHAEGGFYSINPDQPENGGNQFHVLPNFKDNAPVISNPFYNAARIEMENLFAGCDGCTIYNLSDGAYIKGTVPLHAPGAKLNSYRQRLSDIEAIKSSFRPAVQGDNWAHFSITGHDLLRELKGIVNDKFDMPEFQWLAFSHKLDAVFVEIVETMQAREGGARMELYLKFILDLLVIWYRFLWFTCSELETEQVYQKGSVYFREILKQINWPDQLDG